MPTVSPAVWDAMTDLMAFGTGAVVVGGSNESYGRGTMPAAPPEPVQETSYERSVRLWKRPMFIMKDDDPQITWDDKAMAARPFRERKQ